MSDPAPFHQKMITLIIVTICLCALMLSAAWAWRISGRDNPTMTATFPLVPKK